MKKLLLLTIAFGLALGGGWYASAQITVLPQSNVFAGIPNLGQYTYSQSDCYGFQSSANNVGEFLSPNASGTGASSTEAAGFDATDNRICQSSTGTTTSGNASWAMGGNTTLGIGSASLVMRVRIEDLSDGTETFTITAGFNDSVTDAGTDSVAFLYTHGTNSGKWLCYTRSNGAGNESTANSDVTVAADTYYKLAIFVNADSSSATFFIDGAQVCAISTNIPSGYTRTTNTRPLHIVKSAGTTARLAYMDYFQYIQAFTTAR